MSWIVSRRELYVLAQVSNRLLRGRFALGLIAHRPLRETMLDPTVKYRLPKGTIRSGSSVKSSSRRKIRSRSNSASSSARDDARLTVLCERRCLTLLSSIDSRRGRYVLAQVSNRLPGGRFALGLIAHRPLRETMLD